MKLKQSLLLAAGLALFANPAKAAFTFTNGDLILGFQATGGQGSNQNVFFNLGSGTDLRDGGISGNIGNINTTMSLVFGNNWSDRTDLHFGVVGNLNYAPTSGIGSASPVDGDPSRTFYVSRAADSAGNSVLWTGFTTNALGTAGSSLQGMESMILGLNTEADGTAILNQSTQPTAWSNGWTTFNPTPGSSFNTFGGGIQQAFGATENANLDIQRILATNTGAVPTGTVGTGSVVGTLIIGDNGSLTMVPEPSSALLAASACGLIAFRRRRSHNA